MKLFGQSVGQLVTDMFWSQSNDESTNNRAEHSPTQTELGLSNEGHHIDAVSMLNPLDISDGAVLFLARPTSMHQCRGFCYFRRNDTPELSKLLTRQSGTVDRKPKVDAFHHNNKD